MSGLWDQTLTKSANIDVLFSTKIYQAKPSAPHVRTSGAEIRFSSVFLAVATDVIGRLL